MITDHYRRMVEGKWSGWRDLPPCEKLPTKKIITSFIISYLQIS